MRYLEMLVMLSRSKLAALSVLFLLVLPLSISNVWADEDYEDQMKPPIMIQVTGYAFYKADEKSEPDPKRLLAIRASKLDAYRNLAERVYGISVAGNSTVHDFTLKDDQFSVQLESVIRGARVVSIIENKKTGIETVLELALPGNFIDCLNNINSFRSGPECVQPLPTISRSAGHSSLRAPMTKQYLLN